MATAPAQSVSTRRAAVSSPVLVTRGETHTPAPPHLALIDWFAVTIHPGEHGWHWVYECVRHVFGLECTYEGKSRPWHGYHNRIDLITPSDRGESINLGLIAWGGESQRGTVHVSLNGQACARIQDWPEVQRWCESIGANITRLDLAHDDLSGETVSIKTAREWFTSGGFSSNGRPPQAELYDDLGSGKGKTFYVGKRQFGKLCRVYEKGKKEGDTNSPWCRVEIEFRNKNRVIPYDALTRPGDYLAGAYPCLAYLSEHQERIKTVRRAAEIQYSNMVVWLKTSAGKALNVMHQVEHGDASAVLDQVMRDGKPKRLQPFAGYDELLEQVAHADTKP